jgi:hypothetical protein
MPKYSGYELLQTFTTFSRTQTIPVIIVSGEAGGQTREHCKKLGAAGYFEKPVDFDALRACLLQVAKSRKHIPRTEVRVRLRVALMLRSSDGAGKKFEAIATTENVSLSGFLCNCTAEIAPNTIVNVSMSTHKEEYVGKAKIIHADSKGAPLWHYGCRFTEKTGPWLLQ